MNGPFWATVSIQTSRWGLPRESGEWRFTFLLSLPTISFYFLVGVYGVFGAFTQIFRSFRQFPTRGARFCSLLGSRIDSVLSVIKAFINVSAET